MQAIRVTRRIGSSINRMRHSMERARRRTNTNTIAATAIAQQRYWSCSRVIVIISPSLLLTGPV